jgi:hypothetical protein
MSHNKLTYSKQTNSTYQSLYLWTSFLLGMISLGIVVWNRSSVIPSNARNLLGNSPIIPVQTGIHENPVIPNAMRNLLSNYRMEIPRFTRDDNSISTYQINFPSFTSSLILSALTYQQTQNIFASALTLFWSSVLGLQIDKRQISQDFQVNNYSVGVQFQPVVAALGDSTDFMVVWSSDNTENNTSRDVYGRRFNRNGLPVTGDIILQAGTNNSVPYPAIASLDDRFIITWRSANQTGDGWDLLGQMYNSNDSIMENNFLIVHDNYSADYEGGLSSIVTNPQLKMFIVSWDSFTPDMVLDFDCFARVYSENGSALTNFFQINNPNSTGDQSRRSFKLLSDGNWIIAYHDSNYDNPAFKIVARLYTYPDILGPEFIVNQFIQNNQKVPVAIPFLNEFVIIWKSQGPEINNDTVSYLNNYGVYGRGFYNNGTALGNEFRVNFHTLAYWDGLTAIAINQDYFAAFWLAYKDRRIDTYDIYGQICSKVGERIGPEFLVNNAHYSVYYSAFGTLAADVLDNTSFVVIWNSMENDDIQIKARIFTLEELGISLLPPTSVSTESIYTTLITTASTRLTDPISTTNSANSESLSSSAHNNCLPNDNPNIAGYAGGAAAGGVVLGGLLTAGFFICRNKLRAHRDNNTIERKTEVELRDTQGAISTSSNYARGDEIKKLEKEYDIPMKLEI